METGTVVCEDHAWRATLSRSLPHDAALVWRTLTDPGRFPYWLAQGTIELRAGGEVRLEFAGSGTVINSSVTEYAEGRVLGFSWSSPAEPQRPVRLGLRQSGAHTELEVTLGLPAEEDITKHCAGWEAHLAMLAAAIDGAPIEFPFEIFMQAREAYSALT